MSDQQAKPGRVPPVRREAASQREGLGTGIPAPGDVVAGKYEIERVLGSGGMGVVVAARHKQLGQRVAIKFMRAEAAQDGNAVERFLREARAAVALSSEHVTRVIDVGKLETGEPYMVMEYLDDVDLGQVLREHGSMPIVEVVDSVLSSPRSKSRCLAVVPRTSVVAPRPSSDAHG